MSASRPADDLSLLTDAARAMPAGVKDHLARIRRDQRRQQDSRRGADDVGEPD